MARGRMVIIITTTTTKITTMVVILTTIPITAIKSKMTSMTPTTVATKKWYQQHNKYSNNIRKCKITKTCTIITTIMKKQY